MSAIPKGSSIPHAERMFLGRESALDAYCVLCGTPYPDQHHEPPRSRIPKALHKLIPRFSLCGPGNTAGTCHGMAHRNGGTVITEVADEGYWFRFDPRAEGHINERRRKNGLPEIHDALFRMTRGGGL